MNVILERLILSSVEGAEQSLEKALSGGWDYVQVLDATAQLQIAGSLLRVEGQLQLTPRGVARLATLRAFRPLQPRDEVRVEQLGEDQVYLPPKAALDALRRSVSTPAQAGWVTSRHPREDGTTQA